MKDRIRKIREKYPTWKLLLIASGGAVSVVVAGALYDKRRLLSLQLKDRQLDSQWRIEDRQYWAKRRVQEDAYWDREDQAAELKMQEVGK